jgi:tRNA G10  N-methylase Trm11
MLDIAGVADGASVLEPSAGKGGIAIPAMERGCAVTAMDIHQPYLVELVLKVSVRYGAAAKMGFSTMPGDFLATPPDLLDSYDAVIMNPPFSRNQDMLHVRHAAGFLKRGGILVSVMCPGWTYRTTNVARSFKNLAEALSADWRKNPPKTFYAAGTSVETGLFVVRRP